MLPLNVSAPVEGAPEFSCLRARDGELVSRYLPELVGEKWSCAQAATTRRLGEGSEGGLAEGWLRVAAGVRSRSGTPRRRRRPTGCWAIAPNR